MNNEQYLKNLTPPSGLIDIVIDTDTYTEIDDQFAIGYMVKHTDRFNVKGICVAPFFKHTVSSIEDGIGKSYNEIMKILELVKRCDIKDNVYKGSKEYLSSESVAVESDAADFLVNIANAYSPEKPLYIVAIGALTNVASAILKNPDMKENCVVVWLGGHASHFPNGADEYNMRNDIAAARVVLGCGIPVVQLPCLGVVDRFSTSKYELEHWLKGKNELCDYLLENTVKQAEEYAAGRPWTRVIWDVVAAAWLLNSGERFMKDVLTPSPIPEYDKTYTLDSNRHLIKSVYWINRDTLFNDLFKVLGE